ncbi:TIM barrel protein [Roseibium porphyridii]|uniref:TIM barrel protein n=1 Tax=Roseibium porphyridii TaxID=2866279 RepID=A0ABY8F2Z6_9HYPH|nr:TIM barrel protein [Roseibium sp. KMA01]WFE89858.1 TIM barrel protein [Roseibium sp. KMA01]
MLGLGSFSYRWSCGFKDRIPEKPLGLLDLLDRAELANLSLVQFADNIPLHERDNGEIAELATESKAKGISVELGLAGATDTASLTTYLGYANQLDCELIRVSLDATDLQKGQCQLVAELKEIEQSLVDQSVRIAFENHFAISSPELASLVQRLDSDRFGVCLDVANSICAGEWPLETVNILAPFAINLHLKDCRFVPDPYGVGFKVEGVPLGKGIVDIGAVFDRLRPDERGINIILEHWLPWECDQAALSKREDEWVLESALIARRVLETFNP